MKKYFLILFILVNHFSWGQSFNKLIQETNQYLEYYSHTSPFSYDFISFTDTHLSTKEIKELKKIYEEAEEYLNPQKDSILEEVLIFYYQEKIINNIEKIIQHKKIKKYIPQIKSLLNQDNINIAISEDHKLINFYFDEKTGGTYRSQISMLFYLDKKNKENKYYAKEGISVTDMFSSDGYDEIYSIKTKEGTKYLLKGYVRGCTYCFYKHISLYAIKKNRFQKEFEYSLESESPELEMSLEYNANKKIITAEYLTNPLSIDCECENILDIPANASNYFEEIEELEIERKECTCIFKFNGRTFEGSNDSNKIINYDGEE